MEVISIEEIESENVVYDLETEAGTFLAGGLKHGIMVKNTDSCYVQFPIHKTDYPTEEEYMKVNFKMAEDCAKFCTGQFKPPIELAFEKYMYPLMLFAKKRYAYKEWTNPSIPDEKIHYKGIQIVRRDTCKYVAEEMDNTFGIIMNQKSIEEAYRASIDYVQKSVKNLLDGNVDINKLVLSKQLKSKYTVRKNNISKECHWTNPEIQQPHVRLAQELMVKNPANCPKPPDRVPYLFIEKKGNNVLQCDKVIHPMDFSPSVNKLDSLYYFERQYKKPIDMIFQFMIDDTEKIYSRMISSKINQLNGQKEISSFFKVKEPSVVANYVYDPKTIEDIEIIEDDGEDDDID